jgi:hypothetical protein
VPKRKRYSQWIYLSVAAFVATCAAALLGRRRPTATIDEQENAWRPLLEPVDDPPPAPRPKPRTSARFAVVASFTILFFAGASFTAGAGDEFAGLLEEDVAAELAAAEAAAEAAAPEAAAPEAEPAPEAAPAAEPAAAPAPEAAPAPAPEAAPAPESAPELVEAAAVLETYLPESDTATPAAPPTASAPAGESAPAAAPKQAAAPKAAASPRASAPKAAAKKRTAPSSRKWVVKRAQAKPSVEPEHHHGQEGGATIWLNRALPDPTPAAARLTREFARDLGTAARRNGTSWTIVLGTLRAQGERGSRPATPFELDRLSNRLKGDGWRGALALSGRTSFADRAQAFADYYEAIGLEALVTGLEASKPRLVKRLLADERVTIYAGGREDLLAGRIDVRVVVLLQYLAERHGSVTVSSLFSGHRKYSRPGVISAHTYGHAVDIAAVGGFSVLGNQAPDGITEDAVRSVLLLPAELQPQQVISLLGLGGPSFPMADHGDHIHVGY